MMERLNPVKAMDSKIEALEQHIASKPDPSKKALHYKTLFEKLYQLEEECKTAKIVPQLTILRYNLSNIEHKILESIT